jgi:type IV pilus assembly protein PilV
MKHMGKTNAQKGFTLLELLIAITLIAVALLATAAMQSVAINSNSIANRSTVVTAIAQEVMEEIMSRPGGDPQLAIVPGTAWTYDLDPLTAATDRYVPSAGTFRAIVATNHPSASITQITVTVVRINEATNAPYVNPGAGVNALSGVHGNTLNGGFALTDYKNFAGV